MMRVPCEGSLANDRLPAVCGLNDKASAGQDQELPSLHIE